MLIVPTIAVPSQTLTALINNQNTGLNIYQKGAYLFMDVLLNNTQVIGGVICQNLNVIIRNAYLGYIGDFAWIDTQGSDDPQYTGLNSRWFLGYFLPSELPAGLQ